jgi:hypothetical protein
MTAGRRGLVSVRVAEETAEFGKSISSEAQARLEAAKGRKQAGIFTRMKERVGDFGKSSRGRFQNWILSALVLYSTTCAS